MANRDIAIDALHPTQLTLGLNEVAERAKKISRMSESERQAYLEKKAVPYLVGPGKTLFLVDHHHLCRALSSLGIKQAALGKQIDDWSDLDPKSFWRRAEQQGYCWPIDADGNRRPFSAIPDHVDQLTDNVWRSLARKVRGDAFENQDTPFQEFIWGDYFRTFMSRRLIETRFDLAAKLACDLAHLSEAEDLPGFFA